MKVLVLNCSLCFEISILMDGLFKGCQKIKQKPIISGFNRKCVGGAGNHDHFLNQWVRIRRFHFYNILLWSSKGRKPIISGSDRSFP